MISQTLILNSIASKFNFTQTPALLRMNLQSTESRRKVQDEKITFILTTHASLQVFILDLH